MGKVIVVGGGAAGMMAAIVAARNGHQVTLLEKNEKLGKKLFITGKGRCNFTNAGDYDDLMNNVVTNSKFLYSAFSKFSNYDAMSFFDELGLTFKVERGNRVFPESDHSSDVIRALTREIQKLKVEVLLNCKVISVISKNNTFQYIEYQDTKHQDVHGHNTDNQNINHHNSLDKKQKIYGDKLVLATGGKSYQSTGSSGDGYQFAKDLGHTITPLLPALVPFTVLEEWEKELQGLSLKNINVSFFDDKKLLYSEFGELLFTHFGVSGPVILSASSFITSIVHKKNLKMVIDLKPALSVEKLDERVLRDFDGEKNKSFKNALDKLLPKRLISVIVEQSGINPDKKVHVISKEERMRLVSLLKNFTMTITGTRGFEEAIITQGGVMVKEINPATMESKIVKGVYFAGELMDVDALTGGFNLQIAWSTAYVAGTNL